MSAYFGYAYSRRYVLRERYFINLLQFCERLNSDITFSHIPLSEILQKSAGSFDGLLSEQLNSVTRLLSDNRSTDDAALREYVPQGHLTEGEYDSVIRFLGILGKSDAENQAASVQSYAVAFKVFYKDAAEGKKKYASLFIKLGILAGAAIAIFII